MVRIHAPAVPAKVGKSNGEALSAPATVSETSDPFSAAHDLSAATGPGWDFARIPIHSVSRPGDAAECEADAMAEKALSNTFEKSGTTPEAPNASFMLAGGRPLDHATRNYFESRFRADLGRVSVHDHSDAHRAASRIGANAFTLGQNIAFARGQYSPGTEAGRKLMAHELAHTIQQRSESAPAGIFRKPIPGWNFTPSDFAKRKKAGQDLRIAVESYFLPPRLQANLLNTLRFVLGGAIKPAATEGINAMDFFHGHLVVRNDTATNKQSKALEKKGQAFSSKLETARKKTLAGPEESRSRRDYPMTEKNLGGYRKEVEKLLPSFGNLLDEGAKIPGAAVMYHTYESVQPSDLKDKKLTASDPRRHYVTPLETNLPRQYSPPQGGYSSEFTVITGFSFLVDQDGVVYVRPFHAGGGGFSTLELSTITGSTFPEPFESVY